MAMREEEVKVTYTLKGSFGSEVRITLNDTFPPAAALAIAADLLLLRLRSV